MNFRIEKNHDYLLRDLINELSRIQKLDIFETYFGTPQVGKLVRVTTRIPFDLEVTFDNLSVIIESKVDSDEYGRWNGDWQTTIIYNDSQSLTYLNNNKYFCLITYGTSEYYTKNYNFGAGCSKFKHITLKRMIDFIKSCLHLQLHDKYKFEEWLKSLKIEVSKRENAFSILEKFASFRKQYLSLHSDIDFPTNRLALNAPELAFPVFGKIAEVWNNSPNYYSKYGKVSVYPVGRRSPSIHDSILNFWEMWRKGPFLTFGGILTSDLPKKPYFEINEDYNLNLKLGLDENICKMVSAYLQSKPISNIPNTIVKGRYRFYKQSVFVLYEWDFGLLDNIQKINIPINNLYITLDYLYSHLA